MTEEQLIAQYYACNDPAFETLVAIYRPKLKEYFERHTNDPARAEALTHEVLIRILMTKGRPTT